MNLSVSIRADEGSHGVRTVVQVGGEIDLYTAAQLREHLVDLVTDGRCHLIFDLEHVEFLDSTGLGVLLGALKRARAHGGSLQLVCSQDRILKVLRVTALNEVFQIHSSVDDAVNASV